MGENSGIEWTHHTFNPWIGCTKVSAACDHCYAEAWDKRFNGERWGPKSARTRTRPANWSKPVTWDRKAAARGIRERVFCASLADVFDNHRSIKPEWRADLWALIRKTPSLDWLMLTKRPQNIARYLPEDWGNGYPNVWLGTTAEDQTEADRRIPHLLRVPAVVHFISAEPLLGEIILSRSYHDYLAGWDTEPECCGRPNIVWGGTENEPEPIGEECCGSPEPVQIQTNKLDWIITGGESGSQHRKASPDWFRALRDQCAAAGVPFLFKQWEGRSQREIKAKGRALDGVVHDGYPIIGGGDG